MSKYIIDILKEEYKDFPITLDGEVFLEKIMDYKGNFSGYLTTTVEKVLEMKTKFKENPEQLVNYKYQHILDSFD